MPLWAHSARHGQGIEKQPYADHVRAVMLHARESAQALGRWSKYSDLSTTVTQSAAWHDLGKLDPKNQCVLNSQPHQPLAVQHECAGVRHLRNHESGMSATLVYSHHRGLPDLSREMTESVPLDDWEEETIDRVDRLLDRMVQDHMICLSDSPETPHENINWRGDALKRSGLFWRLALSCLVDADHTDTARHYGNGREVTAYEGRWGERRQALERYVAKLSENADVAQDRRALRQLVYEGCKSASADHAICACDSGVGTGKTTAIMAHALRIAEERQLRHIFVVLPWTNVIDQSVRTYRRALALEDEHTERVVAAHHHAVDFESPELRQLATLWDCPVTVTTAVQFFGTLASRTPRQLRKLHELPGSAIFIDEAHAALPAWLWPQTWLWIKELTDDWGCHFVFGSGSLVRFWQSPKFATTTEAVPDLLPASTSKSAQELETARVRFVREDRAFSFESLTHRVLSLEHAGPYLVIVNTVQTAAELANFMRRAGHDVLHMSTALAPIHRKAIADQIEGRLLNEADKSWALVATSCVESGLDFNFGTAWREQSSVTSVIQVGGRVNRHGTANPATVYVFRLDDPRATANPALKIPIKVLHELFDTDALNLLSASDACTKALRIELAEGRVAKLAVIRDLEGKRNFPEVEKNYRVIEDETVLVLVEPALSAYEDDPAFRSADLARGSVRVRADKIKKYAARLIDRDLYAWTLDYDPEFLGYMDGVLKTQRVIAGEFTNA